MRFRGDLFKAGQLYLSAVLGEVDSGQAPGGITSWEGWFGPRKATPPPGDDYRLVLEDGRTAALRVYATEGKRGAKRTLFKLNGGWDPMP
jgi:hypothetical protein